MQLGYGAAHTAQPLDLDKAVSPLDAQLVGLRAEWLSQAEPFELGSPFTSLMTEQRACAAPLGHGEQLRQAAAPLAAVGFDALGAAAEQGAEAAGGRGCCSRAAELCLRCALVPALHTLSFP
jgi:hypothetical protein